MRLKKQCSFLYIYWVGGIAYFFCPFNALGVGTKNAKMAPRIAAIQRTCRAVVMPQVSAPQPMMGETRPPMVVERPRVTPEAKPTFLPKYVCPKTTTGL